MMIELLELLIVLALVQFYKPARNYIFKVSNRNTRTRCEKCLKLTINTPERRNDIVNDVMTPE